MLLHLVLPQSLDLLLSDLFETVLLGSQIHPLAICAIQRHCSKCNHGRVMNELPHLLSVHLVWKLIIVVIAHHQQVSLELLLLRRV